QETDQHMPEPLMAEDAEPPSRIRIGERPSVSTSRTTTETPAALPPFFAPSAKAPQSRTRPRERFPSSPRSQLFRKTFFPAASAADWSDWRWQFRNRVKDLASLSRILELSPDETEAIRRHRGSLPV